jgi:hypothetical protein
MFLLGLEIYLLFCRQGANIVFSTVHSNVAADAAEIRRTS